MTIDEAIAELKEDIALYIPTNGTIEEIDRELPDGRLITALEMAILALKEHSDYKLAWDNLKESIQTERDNCKVSSLVICSFEHRDTLSQILDLMSAAEEEITDCYIARRLKEAENEDRD